MNSTGETDERLCVRGSSGGMPPRRSRGRRGRLIHEMIHDPYKGAGKLSEPSVCTVCGAVCRDGRWRWGAAPPKGADRVKCQACRRIEDNHPAGVVTLSGPFAVEHERELIDLMLHEEGIENRGNPLHRIMSMARRPGAIVVRTTDIELPRRIGRAVQSAWNGDLEVQYDEEGYSVRVKWVKAATHNEEQQR